MPAQIVNMIMRPVIARANALEATAIPDCHHHAASAAADASILGAQCRQRNRMTNHLLSGAIDLAPSLRTHMPILALVLLGRL